jgi:hypothetical protein
MDMRELDRQALRLMARRTGDEPAPRGLQSCAEVVRWLWDYLPTSPYRCNPLSVPSDQALKIVARYAWERPNSGVGIWYGGASEYDQSAFRRAWYDQCRAVR